MPIGLGDTARDTVTGFEGVVVSRHEYLNGCVRLGLQSSERNEGRPIDPYVVDVQQAELVSAAKPATTQPTGGPRNEPSRPKVPSR